MMADKRITKEQIELEEMIKGYATAYYTGESEVSDEVFDSLVDELRDKYPESEVLNMVGWGFDVSSADGAKADHLYGMTVGSIPKIKNVDSYKDERRTKYRVSAKLDGLSVVSYYENGVRVKAITRGNGHTGIDVTAKMHVISPETDKLMKDFTGALRGEVLCSNQSWYVVQRDYGDKYSNQRNFASGVLNSKGLTDQLKYLDYIIYKVVADPEDMVDNGFLTASLIGLVPSENIVPVTNCELDMKSLEDSYEYFKEAYPCDGLVITNVNFTRSDEGAIEYDEKALKFEAHIEETVVTGIEWSSSRTGRVVPVINFEPVLLSGAMVGKCTGNNAKMIKDLKVGVGSVIKVNRANEVIPHLVEVVTEVEPDLPKVCPKCGAKLEWDGVDLVCPYESDDIAYHFVTTVADVDGAGSMLYLRFIELFELSNADSVVNLISEARKDMNKFIKVIDDNVSGKSFRDKLVKMLEILIDKVDLQRALVACNIPGVSWTTAGKIISEYDGDLVNDILNDSIDYDKIYSINGIGGSVVDSIKSKSDTIRKVVEVLDIKTPEPEEEVKFYVAITGALSMKRDDFDKLLRSKGIQQSGNFNEVKYLITNNPDKQSSKMKKAVESGVEIISEEDFIDKFLNN